MNILIIDDEKSQLEILAGFLSKKGYKVYTAESGAQGLKIIREKAIDIVISDFRMPEMTGLEILEEVLKINPAISFIIITAYGTIKKAVEAIRLGAVDYISKPVDLFELEMKISQAFKSKSLKSENNRFFKDLEVKNNLSTIISKSANMAKVINIAYRSAKSKATILLMGENGTGKEVIARAIHNNSLRKDKPFVPISIHALPANLVESELFGYEKGAFTGAEKTKKGRFELAHGGTLFLDEIGDIFVDTQVKILRVLQEHQFERVGGIEAIEVDVRIIAATNKDLEKKIMDGTFREDLFYRLNVVPIRIPPLRERKEDILPLIEHFIDLYCRENNRNLLELSKEASDVLMKYNYPGNVRELENIIERAVILTRGDLITLEDLPIHLRGMKENTLQPGLGNGTLPQQVGSIERELIHKALQKSGGNRTVAGRLLGITERMLRYKIKKYNIRV